MPPSTATAGAAKGSLPNTLLGGAVLVALPTGLGQGMLVDRYKENILELIEMYGPFFVLFWNTSETLVEQALGFGGFI